MNPRKALTNWPTGKNLSINTVLREVVGRLVASSGIFVGS
jgi:hypothetical protein